MAYINTSTLIYPISEADIREANPNVSFPVPFVAPEEFANVFQAPKPAYDVATQYVREIAPELTVLGHYEQRWEVLALDADQIEALRMAAADAKRQSAKVARQAAVDAIKVAISSGKVFDGDELSQTRMSRAIIGLQAAGVPTIRWTLADNTSADVTAAELIEALILAGQAQAAVWEIAA